MALYYLDPDRADSGAFDVWPSADGENEEWYFTPMRVRAGEKMIPSGLSEGPFRSRSAALQAAQKAHLATK